MKAKVRNIEDKMKKLKFPLMVWISIYIIIKTTDLIQAQDSQQRIKKGDIL